MNFIKRVLSTVTGIFVFFIISIIGIIVLGLFFGTNQKQRIIVKPNSVLDLKLDFPIVDYPGKIVFSDYPFLDEDKKNGLFDIIDAVNYAATDPNITGISISNNFVQAGITQIKSLRQALEAFKVSGKFIVAYADIFTQKDYYLSSVSDTIFLNPAGDMSFKGLYTERYYLKELQENSGIKMEVIRLGKYKSAVEPFLENEMSANNRKQISSYLNRIWNEIKLDISKSRHLSIERLNNIADSLLARNPKLAKASKMIDKIAYYDDYLNGIKHAIGTDQDPNFISIADYADYAATQLQNYSIKNKIAVIYAQGDIVYGEGDNRTVGQGLMTKALKSARDDKQIKAVVLRVNSPGGSALASELIWREIELTKKQKPVIVSMGDIAASGGYYIAAGADHIIAESCTITGSIGVFGMMPNGKGLADKMGINAEQVKTNTNAIPYSFLEPLDDNQLIYIKESINDVYELFSKRVSEGRQLTREQVENIAQGRVWTGLDALDIGLVDELGGLSLALQRAAEAANIDAYRVEEFPVIKKDLDKILESVGLVQSKESMLQEILGEENLKIFQELKVFQKKKGIQLLFPFSTEMK